MVGGSEKHIGEGSSEARLVFCADMHGNKTQYHRIFSFVLANRVARLVFGGDITPKNKRERTPNRQREFLEQFLIPTIEMIGGEYKRRYNETLKVLLFFGNDDFRTNEDVFYRNDSSKTCIFINNSVYNDRETGISFIGYSYVPFTPFEYKDWEKIDVCARRDKGRIAQSPPRVKLSKNRRIKCISSNNLKKEEGTIYSDLDSLFDVCDFSQKLLLSHAPPINTKLDMLYDGSHVGSEGVRKSIEDHCPLVSLHGHIHETVQMSGDYKQKIGGTLCASPGNDHLDDSPWILDCHLSARRKVKRIKI